MYYNDDSVSAWIRIFYMCTVQLCGRDQMFIIKTQTGIQLFVLKYKRSNVLKYKRSNMH